MHSNPAPGVDDKLTRLAATPPELTDDPVRRLVEGPPDPMRHFGLRHWLGVLSLVAAIAVAAFVLPPLITPATAPLGSGSSSPFRPTSPSTTAPSGPVTITPTRTPTSADATGPTSTRRPPSADATGPAGATKRKVPKETTRKTATKFAAVTIQAETGSLSEGAAAVGCDTCESGARVRYVGRVDVHATIPSPGTYHLTVVYEADGPRQLTVSINDGPPIASRTVTGNGWTTPARLTLSAALPAGTIDIGVYGDGGNAPDIDAVTIS